MSQRRGLWGRAPATAHPLASSARPAISLKKTDGISLRMLLRAGRGGGWGPPIPEPGGLGRAGTGHAGPQGLVLEAGRGEAHGSREVCCSSPAPTPALLPSSHHILSSPGGPEPSSPITPPAFRPPPQASCLGDLLPAPQLPDLGVLPITGPVPQPTAPPALGPKLLCLPLLFPHEKHKPTNSRK